MSTNPHIRREDGFPGQRIIVLPPIAIDIQQNDLLTESIFITDIGHYPNAEGHYCRRDIPIDQYVLLYCIKGCGVCEINGLTHKLNENQYIILPSRTPHAYGASDSTPWSIYWIHFQGRLADEYAKGCDVPHDVVMEGASARNKIFEDIFNVLGKSPERDNLRYASSLFHHYLASLKYQRKSVSEMQTAPGPDEFIDRYIDDNIEKHITLDELANYCGVSKPAFPSYFKAIKGQSPLTYVNHCRIRKAMELLHTTGLHINQICHKVGIEDCYYFSRKFKEITGVSPRAFRSQN